MNSQVASGPRTVAVSGQCAGGHPSTSRLHTPSHNALSRRLNASRDRRTISTFSCDIAYERQGAPSAPPGVLADLAEVDPDARLIADGFGVVAGRNGRGLTGPDLRLAAVVHVDLHAAGHAVTEVRHLARIRLRDRLEIGRPLPTW